MAFIKKTRYIFIPIILAYNFAVNDTSSSEPIPYSPRKLVAKIDKNYAKAMPYDIPTSEQVHAIYSTNHLYLIFDGEVHRDTPLLIQPTPFSVAKSPYEVLCNYLYVAHRETPINYDSLVGLFDPASQSLVGSQPADIKNSVCEILSSVHQLEAILSFQYAGKTVTLAKQLIGDSESILLPWQTCLVSNKWFMKSGKVGASFLSPLLLTLQDTGVDNIHDKFTVVYPQVIKKVSAPFTDEFFVDVVGLDNSDINKITWIVNGEKHSSSEPIIKLSFDKLGKYIIEARVEAVDCFVPSIIDVISD